MPRKRTGPRYAHVYATFWTDAWGWPDDEKLAALHLLTCPERSTEGLFALRAPSAAAALGPTWTAERLWTAWHGLEERRVLLTDDGLGWVLLPDALRWQRPANADVTLGAVRKVATAPRESALWPVFLAAARHWAPRLGDALGAPREEDAEAAFHRAVTLYLMDPSRERGGGIMSPIMSRPVIPRGGGPEGEPRAARPCTHGQHAGPSSSTSTSGVRAEGDRKPEYPPAIYPVGDGAW